MAASLTFAWVAITGVITLLQMVGGLVAQSRDAQILAVWNTLVLLVYVFIGYGILKRHPRAYRWAVGSNILNVAVGAYQLSQGTAQVHVVLLPLEIGIVVILYLNRQQFLSRSLVVKDPVSWTALLNNETPDSLNSDRDLPTLPLTPMPTSQTTAAPFTFCPKCGTQNDNARFCRQCGTELTGAMVTDSTIRKNGSKVVGWLLVAAALVTAFVPDSVVPQEGSKLLAFVMLTAGFGLVLSGASAIRRFGAGTVAAAVIVFPLYYLRSSMPGNASDANAAAMDVQMSVLLSDYSSNEVAADQRYKGRLIRVNGVVSDIKKDLMDKPFVLLNAGDGFRTVQCAFATSAVADAAKLRSGEPVTLQGVVQGLMVNVQVTDCTVVTDAPVAAVQEVTPTPSSQSELPAATTALPASASEADSGLDGLVRKVAALATVPLAADYGASEWDQLASVFPIDRWNDVSDDDFAFAKQVESLGVTVSAKGARTMVLQTSLDREFSAGDRVDVLFLAFSAVFPVPPVRCVPDVQSYAERWYSVAPDGSKPVLAHYEFSRGSGEGIETLTFQTDAELPKVGEEAIGGTWSDRCSR